MGTLETSKSPALEGQSILAFPFGSCEQHGPHMPLNTDTRIAESAAESLAKQRPNVMIGPSVSIGASGEHQEFPGTLSIGNGALTHMAVELGRSALPPDGSELPQPFSAVLFINGHGGNVKALDEAVALLVSESRRVAVWHPRVPGGDPHAGHTETSVMLHLHPDTVDMTLAEPGSAARFSEIGGQIATEGLQSVAPNGVLGDPTTANPSDGKRIFLAMVTDLISVLDRLANLETSD